MTPPALQPMYEPSALDPVLPIVGLLVAGDADPAPAERLVLDAWGPLLVRSPVTTFACTRFYQAEMGPDIRRYWLAGRTPVSGLHLAEMKRTAVGWESRFLAPPLGPGRPNRRTFNIDPGYVGLGQLVLASTKPAGHRIPIAPGLFAESTLTFHDGEFFRQPWTYLDYWEHKGFFEAVRHAVKMLHRKGEPELPKWWAAGDG